MADLIGCSAMPKSFSLGGKNNAIKLLVAKSEWTSHIAHVVMNCNGNIFKFTIGCYKTSTLITDVIAQDFNSGSYRIYKDSDSVYIVCINKSTLNDKLIVYSSTEVEYLTDIDTTSMTEVPVS